MSNGHYNQLQRRLIPFLKHTTGFDFPTSLTLPLPAQDTAARKRVHKIVHNALRAQHIRDPLHAYYISILTVPLTAGKTMKSVMKDTHLGFSLQKIQRAIQSAEMFGCAPATCTNQTHYGTEHTTCVLHAKYHHIISHPSNCKRTPLHAQVKGTIRNNVKSMCMCLPPPFGHRSTFMRDVTAHVTALMSRTRAPVRVR